MAIIKEIELGNGVKLNYHRVVSVNNITNHATIIEVGSYTNKNKREEEKYSLENNIEMDVFIETEYISIPYNPETDVNVAYNYLKTLGKFSNAIDD